MSCYTLTLGDRAENEVGMAMIGEEAKHGVCAKKLIECLYEYSCMTARSDCNPRLYDLHQILPEHEQAAPANVLVFENGVDWLLNEKAEDAEQLLFEALESMPKDTTTWAYGKVQRKHARHNNCLATYDQAPDIANKKGTVVNYKKDIVTRYLFEQIMWLLQPLGIRHPLVGELNHYFDSDKCYIGFHGDSERKIVVGVRCGPGADGFPLKFQWYRNHAPVGDTGYIPLNRGDIYIMSEKAVGTDWRKTEDGLLTLRHAAGTKSAVKRPKRKRDYLPPKSVRLHGVSDTSCYYE